MTISKFDLTIDEKWEKLRVLYPKLKMPTFHDLMEALGESPEKEEFLMQLMDKFETGAIYDGCKNALKVTKKLEEGKKFKMNNIDTKTISKEQWRKMKIPTLPADNSRKGGCTRCEFCTNICRYWVILGYAIDPIDKSKMIRNSEIYNIITCGFDELLIPKKFGIQGFQEDKYMKPYCQSYKAKMCESENCSAKIKWNKNFCPKHQRSHRKKFYSDLLTKLLGSIGGILKGL